ncbi:MAG TPA: prepilin peptidase [Vitreimonas sp.]|nr:prepilin peptidase [Vitreimonas sp.]
MLSVLTIAVFAGLLIYAACFDVARMIIPNWVSVALAVSFPVFALMQGVEPLIVGLHLLVGAGALVVGFFLFHGNIIGGGDAKLLAATATWAGVAGFAPLFFWMAISGGVLALALMTARKWTPHVEGAPGFVNKLLISGGGIPYGVAIMCGGLMSIPALPFVLGR